MAKKEKNQKHKEAVRRKRQAQQEAQEIGLRIEDDIVSLGFVFTHLQISHLNYMALNSINNICRTYAGMDMCIFTQHSGPICVPTLCPVCEITSLSRWYDKPLVTTSIGTTLDGIASNASVVYHYMFDPEFIDKHYKEPQEILPAFIHPKVKVITRHQSHKDMVEAQFGIKTCDTIIEDCNVVEIAKLVFSEIKDDGCN